MRALINGNQASKAQLVAFLSKYVQTQKIELADMLAWTSTMHTSEHSRDMISELTDYQVEIICD